MPIQTTCTCGRGLTLPDASAGRRGKCPACGAMLSIPTLHPDPDPKLKSADPSNSTLSTTPSAENPLPPPAVPPPGLALAGNVQRILTVLLVVGLLLGAWGVVRFFKRMNFDAYVRDGDHCLANGFPGEADTAYRRAQEIYPDDPALAGKFAEVAAYRKWKEGMSLKGQPVGSVGLEMVNRMSEAERRQREFEQRLTRPPPHK